MLLALGAVSANRAAAASVSGVVRDSAGVPQIGAEVEVLNAGLDVVASTYTNAEGRFLIASIAPGRYILKAIGPSFLPSQRENVRVRRSTVVNLTLYTLYEVIQWLPAQPRSGKTPRDDWAWTLRSAANRPLLRWLEDGPLVVDSDGAGRRPRLKARILATGQAGAFGEQGERISSTVEDTPSDSRELLARVDFAPNSDAGLESMLGFRQDLGLAGSVESVAAVTVQPEIVSGGSAGLDEFSVRSTETMNLGDTLDVEFGSNAAMGRMAGLPSGTATAILPYATAAWHDGAATVQYRLATMANNLAASVDEVAAGMPALAVRSGDLTIEHGLYQEIGWRRQTDASTVSVSVFSGRVENPVLEAQGSFTPGGTPLAVLFDPMSSLLRAAGPAYRSTGVALSLERRLPGQSRVRLRYASGSALVMPALPQAPALASVLASANAHHAQTYSITLSGTVDGTRTQWRASYSWQPDDTITAVEPFAQSMDEPYLNLQFRQPVRLLRDGSASLDALLDLSNLLAQGYRPYLLSDGTLLLFAQQQRGIRAGVAFTF